MQLQAGAVHEPTPGDVEVVAVAEDFEHRLDRLGGALAPNEEAADDGDLRLRGVDRGERLQVRHASPPGMGSPTSVP